MLWPTPAVKLNGSDKWQAVGHLPGAILVQTGRRHPPAGGAAPRARAPRPRPAPHAAPQTAQRRSPHPETLPGDVRVTSAL
ncbi:unnamed protein product [Leptidea sinapis]|uniref:Uncharacterized protein n=1 Tax=Leptidea sinapis TaxID=189913 RepID=A0A5E4PWE1_9NEOP|nr:unnamed protein product [Leptidea sinapis]